MDFAHFGLARRPFRPTPDTDSYCPTALHEAAGSVLARTYADGGGVAVLDGEPGTGKTLVVLRFLESLPAATCRILLQATKLSRPADFFQAILFDLGQPYQGMSEQELRLAVYSELLNALAREQAIVLFIDEAQNLTAEVLEEIRVLGNLESKDSKALLVILVGQSGLRELLNKPESASFAQRVAARARLSPLAREESVRYVRHQLRECGGRPEWLINDEALSLLATHTGGVPRVLNRASLLAFALASAAGMKEVDAEPVIDALIQLELMPVQPDEQPPLGPKPSRPKLSEEYEPEEADILPGPAPRSSSGPSPKKPRKPQGKRNVS